MVRASVLFSCLCTFLSSSGAESWDPQSVEDLHKEYYNIFKTGNRNAASHLWSKFILDRSQDLTEDKLDLMFKGFCPISGSPVSPMDRTRYKVALDKVGGGKAVGNVYHCCWPCICDTQDFIKVDTKSVTTKDGQVKKYNFAVIGDPCKNPDALNKPFGQSFASFGLRGPSETTLGDEAPEVKCENGRLVGAPMSDSGNVIIGMFFDVDPSEKSIEATDFNKMCSERAEQGYNSGMGKIFRKVADITPMLVKEL
eukprot:TRINITY_DN992_c0_g1_i1.p1 TRINITY_DN992_c0_g1~~TRINITY_DN992_c0_g1_i1.p1  ORF type:complete len:254 (-),score=45.47 TRINITY_DN992_c0_g1_i1:442-1203(-)